MTPPRTNEDWLDLARAAGSLSDADPHGATGGGAVAMEALARILGNPFLLETMEVALSGSCAAELARSILSHIRPLCVVAPLVSRASDASLDDNQRMQALDVLQVIARPEALTEVYAIALASEGTVNLKASWALVQGMLALERNFGDDTLEEQIVAYLCASIHPAVRELAAAL